MAKKPPEKIIELMKKHGINKSDLWDCHGTWILLHRAIEALGAAEGVIVTMKLIHHDQLEKCAIVLASAKIDVSGIEFQSLGEAAPYNNKNLYPVAMAEKRAIDRAILKALNLHGYVYSEIESDDFKRSAKAKPAKKAGSGSSQIDDVMAKMSQAIQK
jgi:hypothetical protein